MRRPATRSRWLDILLGRVIARPGLVVVTWVLVLAAAALGLQNLRVDTTTDSVLDRSDAAWEFYQQTVQRFGGDEVLVVAIPTEKPFGAESLDRIREMTAAFERLPAIRRVDSLASVPLIRLDDEGALDLAPPIRDRILQDESAGLLASRVKADRIAPQTLASPDGQVLAVNILLDSESGEPIEETLKNIRDIAGPGRYFLSGVPVFREAVNSRTRAEILLFIPITTFAIAVLIFVLFRSWMAVVIPLVASGLGAITTVAIMAMLGKPFTFSTMILPTVLLALGCAYAMHFLAALATRESHETLFDAFRPIIGPVALSGLTTAIGFLALSVIQIEAVQDLGLFGAIGVCSVLLAVLTLVPALCAASPAFRPSDSAARRVSDWSRRRLLPTLVKRRRLILVAWVLCLGVGAAGLPRIVVNTDVTRWFPKGSPVRDSYEFIRAKLSGISPMQIVIETEDGRRVVDPEVLEAIDGLTGHLQQRREVGKALSVADPIRQLHGALMESDSAGLPNSVDVIEQYLLMLESVDLLGDVITDDRADASIQLRVDQNGSADLIRVADDAESWWKAHGPSGTNARATGIMFEFAHAGDEIARGQIRGLALAFVIIAGILLLIFREPRVAGIAVIPNAVPLVAVFGVMGWVGAPVDASTVSLGALSLGIAVDDTIHLVAARQGLVAGGVSPLRAMDSAMGRVMPALLFTTVSIGLGFAVLALSQFTLVRSLGVITASMMALCFLADVTLLPPLLLGRGSAMLPRNRSRGFGDADCK